jgi:hypothetical protein
MTGKGGENMRINQRWLLLLLLPEEKGISNLNSH